ncbi:dihydroxyacetone kinase subunit L [Bacillus canaveralius]|uniref:phosphoenolpyruvate--glycerone phosphotransferase n=1 Tax=Bacillus canaveralius TaxID=1403243 RepID=A0A2N5GIA3_9BACI|nr:MULTISPECIES: dihydroxyacetone kinase subunit DhaL [Bacillus]PLR80687.1 dihydroxyacetone kinase subunit L [Bacillus canaveralius]PLR83861.1 dihydroxyacetone kinase subunit L [Bacillus sp. V33-4]PLR89104.1 dihydroxyacetone kinase subunit L [Bacillus canaveralius]RSK43146.1 dihydroxyacetone kinase subunit L [Bacillus canaveralius]
MGFGIEQAKQWLTQLSEVYQQQKEYLTELDQAIGDGDHGINMARGFKEAAQKIGNTSYADLGSLFKDTGMTLLAKVGGASGPLYGTAFLKAAGALNDKQEITIADLTAALSASVEGLKQRGKASLREKTMIDVWEPAVDYLQEHQDKINWDDFILFTQEKMEGTKDMEAKKGRATYLGARSVGHIDPGAASSHYLFSELAKAFKGAQS